MMTVFATVLRPSLVIPAKAGIQGRHGSRPAPGRPKSLAVSGTKCLSGTTKLPYFPIPDGVAMDVADWLRGLGLEQYESAFSANEIDEGVLPSLTSEDLREIGVVPIGHRRRLLDAIAALGTQAPVIAETTVSYETPAPASPERRQLTVMFCDLVGSTPLSSRLDPEDLREVIAAYHRAVAGVVTAFDGFVGRYMGDGVLVYFGYPRAHEDDAERAVRAGLGVVDTVARLNVKSGKLQARVGIATGLVVVGDLIGAGRAQEQSVVGETPNLAARLQALAQPDAVVIAAGTRRWSAISLSTAILAPSRSGASPGQCRFGKCCVRAALRAGSRHCMDRGSARWSAARRRSTCCFDARRAPRPATVKSCSSPANPASASRALPRHWRSASMPSRTSVCA